MKKIFTILFATAVAALAIVSCQKNIQEETLSDKDVVENQIHFYSTGIETKTIFGELTAGVYPTLWTTSKGIKISYNKQSSVEATVTPKESNTKADFSPASAFSDDGSGSHVFYAMSPSSAQVSNINKTYNSWNIEIPTSQSPLATSVDEAAQVLYARYNAGTEFPTSVPFHFSHVTAYGKLSFSNFTPDDETITSVTLTAQSNFVGRWYYYVEDYTGDPAHSAGDIVESSASNILTLTTSQSTNIWFACAPVDLSSKTLQAVISTTKGTYTREITFPADKGNFRAGYVSSLTINMGGIPRVSPVVYTKVTDPASLTIGSEIIIVNNSQNFAAGKRGSSTYLAAQSITKTDNKINDPGDGVEVFKIANGNIAGTYALACTSESDKYLKWSESSKIGTEETVSGNSSWGIYITGGVATIRNMGDPSRYILSNNGSSYRFSSYNVGASMEDVAIYKKDGTGSGSITAKIPVSISVTGATSSYNVGDTYSFDGTVTLTYSDLSETSLTSSEYTVNSSSVNMSEAGSYTVTISYNPNPSITTSYGVTVSSGSALTVWTDDFSGVTPFATITSLNGSVTGYTAAYSNISTTYAMTSSIRV